jgi:hypothetical protein
MFPMQNTVIVVTAVLIILGTSSLALSALAGTAGFVFPLFTSFAALKDTPNDPEKLTPCLHYFCLFAVVLICESLYLPSSSLYHLMKLLWLYWLMFHKVFTCGCHVMNHGDEG